MKAFLDTHYLLALLIADHAWHSRAIVASTSLSEGVTTEAVLVAVPDALCGRSHRQLACEVIEELRSDAAIEIVSVDSLLFAAGFERYRSRADKDWSLTDCLSFVVMERHRISDALTADRHFEQAGFRALLRDA